MKELGGKTSDRIRDKDGGIPPESVFPVRRETFEEMPDVDSIRHGGGRGLGQGATRARNGGAS